MNNYNPIADGSYIRERRCILKDFGTWRKMTDEEKQMFQQCHRCKEYTEHMQPDSQLPCPCLTCEHRKTEIQVYNRMAQLRRKYLGGGM